jgi:hypothetical protein
LLYFRSKRKEQQEENRTNKSVVIQHQPSSHDNRSTFYPPPPAPFSSRQDFTSSKVQNIDRPKNVISYSSSINEQQQQGYQPYRFDSSNTQQIVDHFTPIRYESHSSQSKNIPGKSSLSVNNQKSSHAPIPRQFFQGNINGSQSLKQHQSSSHPSILPYPSTFTVQPAHFTSYSHNFDNPINTSQQQQTRRIGYTAAPVYPTSRNYFHLESPANV